MISFKSSAFQNNEVLANRFSQNGANVSPPLEWTGLGEDIKEIAILCEDPDARTAKPFVHWLIYGLNPRMANLPEGLPVQEELDQPVQAKQGLNSRRQAGYMGPKPPAGDDWHHYHFRFYGLKESLNLKPGATREDFERAIAGKIGVTAELVGLYRHDEAAIETGTADEAWKAARRMSAGPEINDHGNKAYDRREVTGRK